MAATRFERRRHAVSSEESSLSDSASTREEEEKTIPFLRRLSDMLVENNDIISFHPGYQCNGRATLGRIVVHDRRKVETDVLPRYFNHASFASLRRQLNYFNFTRVGKGRQRGATYCNEAVVDLPDILRLKRKSVAASSEGSRRECCFKIGEGVERSCSDANYVSSVLAHVAVPPAQIDDSNDRSKKRKLTEIGEQTIIIQHNCPASHTVSDDDTPATERTNSIDVIVPNTFVQDPTQARYALSPLPIYPLDSAAREFCRDDDILAGCSVLLSFCRSRTWFDSKNI